MRDSVLTTRDHEDVERVLKNFEEKWAPEMSRVSLITELDVPPEEVEDLLDSMRWLNRNRHQRLLRAMRSVPACVAVTVTVSAISEYEGGTFWPNFFDAVAGYGTNIEREAWGDAFLRALDVFELPKFKSEGTKKYLSPILAHAGVPNYCLGDYFRALDQGMRHVGANAEAVASWAAARTGTALVNIDVPVRRFLSRGDEFTIDFIDRSMDLLIRLSRDDDPAAAMLPDRVVEAARGYLEDLHRHGARSGSSRAGASERRATVRLDPFEGELILTLPPIDAVDEDVTWLVTTEGRTDRVTPAKQMGGRAIGIREATYPLRRAAKSISITAEGVDRSQEIDLVDPDEPLILFTEAGELMPAHLPLPAGKVWALYALRPGQDAAFASRIVHEAAAPLGWTGWSLAAVDLKGAHAFRLTDEHRPRAVRNDARVTLETTSTAPYVRAAGAPVHVTRPVLHIPDGITATWRLAVVDLENSRTLVERPVESSSATHDTTDPFEGLAAPVVGRFAVTMRGPLGKGLSTTVSIAEGLRVESSVEVRTFVQGGLTPCTMALSGIGLTAVHPELRFTAESIEKSTEVESSTGRLELLVTPPAMAVAVALDDLPDRWLHAAASCSTEDIGRTRLHLRLPHEGEPALRVVADSGVTLQTLQPIGGRARAGKGVDHQAVFDLREASDLISRAGSCTLEIGTEPSIRLARVTPRTLARGALNTDGGIQLIDYAGGSVAGRLWSLWEPWRSPEDFAVDPSGLIDVPVALAGCGPLALHLEVSDPWVPKDPPSLPIRHQSLYIDRSPGAHSRESTLALAGRVEPTSSLSLTRAWSLLAMRMHAPRQLFPQGPTARLTARLRERPTEALEALADRGGTATEHVQLLVSSGLLWTPIEHADDVDHTNDEELADLISASPFLGALVASRRLAGMHAVKAFPEAWAAAAKELGLAFQEILEGKADPAASAGRLDNTRWLDTKDSDEFREIVSELRILPHGLIHGDARVEAALELFGQRKRPALQGLVREGWRISEDASNEFARIGARPLAEALEARRVDSRREQAIAHVGSASMAMAILARLAARGLPEAAAATESLRRYLDDLARYAPTLLAVDVVLAEAHICALLTDEHPIIATLEDDES